MSPELFLADLEEKPARLRGLASELAGIAETWRATGPAGTTYLVGMGSSHYAAQVVAGRMRAAGRRAHAELASTDLLPRLASHDIVIAVSASGGSVETLDAVHRLRGQESRATFVALTNHEDTPLAAACDRMVPLFAGGERGGVACRSFQHTLAVLLCLVPGFDTGVVLRSAHATEDLLERRDAWLPAIRELVLGPDGSWFAAPARRISSSLQSALMLREGPRLAAVGCETGDWSHVDVYLTKTRDYRLLLYAGSPWEPQLLDWTGQRGSTVVAVGTDLPAGAAAHTLRYRHDDDDDVRLLTETVVAELLAAAAWADGVTAG